MGERKATGLRRFGERSAPSTSVFGGLGYTSLPESRRETETQNLQCVRLTGDWDSSHDSALCRCEGWWGLGAWGGGVVKVDRAGEIMWEEVSLEGRLTKLLLSNGSPSKSLWETLSTLVPPPLPVTDHRRGGGGRWRRWRANGYDSF